MSNKKKARKGKSKVKGSPSYVAQRADHTCAHGHVLGHAPQGGHFDGVPSISMGMHVHHDATVCGRIVFADIESVWSDVTRCTSCGHEWASGIAEADPDFVPFAVSFFEAHA